MKTCLKLLVVCMRTFGKLAEMTKKDIRIKTALGWIIGWRAQISRDSINEDC